MPTLPKGKKRSWIPKRKSHEHQVDNSAFYHSKQWRALRNWFIKQNPLCAQCEREGKINGGQCVDHIKPIRLSGKKMWTCPSNLQTLCNPCHAKKSAQESIEYRQGIIPYLRKKK